MTDEDSTEQAVRERLTHALNSKITDVRYEYEVLWRGTGGGIHTGERNIGHLSRALRIGPDKVGELGVTHFTVHYCVHASLSDGSVWISAWEPVDYRGALFRHAGCGTLVFHASQQDTKFLLDADPDPDGELVLVPNVEHGGEPGAIYGVPPRPGLSRYHQHTCWAV